MGAIFPFAFMIVFCGVALWIGRPSNFREPYADTVNAVEARFVWARSHQSQLSQSACDKLDDAYEHVERSKVLWLHGYREAALRNALCALDKATEVERLHSE